MKVIKVRNIKGRRNILEGFGFDLTETLWVVFSTTGLCSCNYLRSRYLLKIERNRSAGSLSKGKCSCLDAIQKATKDCYERRFWKRWRRGAFIVPKWNRLIFSWNSAVEHKLKCLPPHPVIKLKICVKG